MKRILAASGLFSAALAIAHAQAPSPDTQATQQDVRKPDVFLDNHRPLVQKKDKAATSRTVTGVVTDDSGHPLSGALVTITDLKNNEKRTFFTKKDGRYQIDDVSFSDDYNVQAKWKALASESRKISQYDHTAKVVRLLTVKTPEGYAASEAAAAATPKSPPSK